MGLGQKIVKTGPAVLGGLRDPPLPTWAPTELSAVIADAVVALILALGQTVPMATEYAVGFALSHSCHRALLALMNCHPHSSRHGVFEMDVL